MPTVPSPNLMLVGVPTSTASASANDASAAAGQVLAMLADILATNALLLPAITKLGQSLLATGLWAAPTALPTGANAVPSSPLEQQSLGILPQLSAGVSEPSVVYLRATRVMTAGAAAPTTRTPNATPTEERSQRNV